jgi:outer membrane murein-binding lipoprotein Lpp
VTVETLEHKPGPSEMYDQWCKAGQAFVVWQRHVDARFDRLDEKVDRLETDVTQLKADVTVLKADVKELRTDINSMEVSNQRRFDRIDAQFEELRVLIAGKLT